MADEFPFGEGEFNEPPAFFPKDIGKGGFIGNPVEVRVEGVYSTEEGGTVHRFVQLQDDNGKTLPIAIGPFEAMAIHIALEGATVNRPLTHDLMRILIERLEGDVDRVVIDDLWNQTYYAKIYLIQDDEEIEIDCRPSDAIALALRTESRIFVLDSILDATPDEE